MDLTIRHLAPYLPYNLKLQYMENGKVIATGVMNRITHNDFETHPTKVGIGFRDVEHIWMFKPILRPLTQLTEEIVHKGKTIVPIEWLEDFYPTLSFHEECKSLLQEDGYSWTAHMSNLLIDHLLEWHFDIFGLIPNGLAEKMNDK